MLDLQSGQKKNTVFTEAQAGFRKGYSTTDHIFTLHAIIEKQFLRNAKLYVAFVDFYKAFDTVSHTMMWLVLSRLTMLRGMYASIKACVRCSGSELSDYFECLQCRYPLLLQPNFVHLFYK